MTPSWIGAAIGLMIGLADLTIVMAASRASARHGSAAVVRIVAVVSLLAFPVVGWFLGPILAQYLAVPT